jgi:hypothetical protein
MNISHNTAVVADAKGEIVRVLLPSSQNLTQRRKDTMNKEQESERNAR